MGDEPTPYLAGCKASLESANLPQARRRSRASRDPAAFLRGYREARRDQAVQVYRLPTCPLKGPVSTLDSHHVREGSTIQARPCGCHVDGMGILPDPYRLHFCEAHANPAPPKPPRIVVEITGGRLDRVFDGNTGKNLDHELIDWDNIREGDAIPQVARRWYPDQIREYEGDTMVGGDRGPGP